MSVRQIKDAADDLYCYGSDACHLAMERLAGVLRDIGFKVQKKSPRESTLRVYPTKIHRYPLLNPLFVRDNGCLKLVVLSKGDGDTIDRHLKIFRSTLDCTFIPKEVVGSPYYHHGNFVIPLQFIGIAGSGEIDFLALSLRLTALFEFLKCVPVEK